MPQYVIIIEQIALYTEQIVLTDTHFVGLERNWHVLIAISD